MFASAGNELAFWLPGGSGDGTGDDGDNNNDSMQL